MNDKTFLSFLKHADKPFSGWDFSFIEDTGRMKSDLLSWSYGSMALSLIQDSESMLDMGTGGGEFYPNWGRFLRQHTLLNVICLMCQSPRND